ncbi:MoaD/ThiS family protein [Actomonas aquatica]|uniref:Molybdopterin synthase sulfur carrier subunit n=1 Tax=Actomonas aquatica TaxID=2866162 RepID=A0ABZ1C3B3_9BACT|nr:MoaD/ThiS family protein [Opitutus sp. WL0086]WRQ86203.1 MoaD/ThiS family protein [Opitutus sp. WL0086]
MKTIHVRYFAILREQRGVSNETLQTAAADAATLYEELATTHSFTLPVDRLRAAINGDFAPWPAPLNDGDEVVFIPPVAGG